MIKRLAVHVSGSCGGGTVESQRRGLEAVVKRPAWDVGGVFSGDGVGSADQGRPLFGRRLRGVARKAWGGQPPSRR